jgi:hypothetical protein
METKVCSRCESEKPVSEYYSDRNKKDGLCTMCKPCKKLGNKDSYIKHREARLNDVKRYSKLNKDKIAELNKKYREENREKILERNKQYRETNKDKIKELNKKYAAENSDKIMARYWKNRESNLENMKRWKKANRPHLSKYQQKYYKEREAVDEIFRMRNAVASTIYAAFKRKGYGKNTKTFEILGCSYEEFKEHIEAQFEDWMNWGNYGKYNGEPNYGWDLDHIRPSSLAESVEDIYTLNHYTNFQPLCSYINRDVKIDKVDY